jgi:hypothetical protein
MNERCGALGHGFSNRLLFQWYLSLQVLLLVWPCQIQAYSGVTLRLGPQHEIRDMTACSYSPVFVVSTLLIRLLHFCSPEVVFGHDIDENQS